MLYVTQQPVDHGRRIVARHLDEVHVARGAREVRATSVAI
jgi:hypothetical protein